MRLEFLQQAKKTTILLITWTVALELDARCTRSRSVRFWNCSDRTWDFGPACEVSGVGGREHRRVGSASRGILGRCCVAR